MEEVRGGPPGPFEDLEVIRQDAAMPVSRFCQLTGIPRRTYHRWHGQCAGTGRAKGPWPAPVVDARSSPWRPSTRRTGRPGVTARSTG